MHLPQCSILQRTLYDPWFEHDGCGIGFVARIDGTASHDILQKALMALCNLEHRGAVADDARTGDGAGVLTQLPRALFVREAQQQGLAVAADDLAVGMLFLPPVDTACAQSRAIIAAELATAGLNLLAWRDVPTDEDTLGRRALENKPFIQQVLITRPAGMSDVQFERTLYIARKQMERAFSAAGLAAYVTSLSSRTIVYKGLMLGSFLADFYRDLRDPDYVTALAVYHQRYSTNTFPTWERAQPFRILSHNGEINTLQGNLNWMRARQHELCFPQTDAGGNCPDLRPVLDESGSDSAMLDNALELLVTAGRDLRHAVTMLAPEAWERIPDLSPELRAFYQYHACMMEPWDGPAALAFSDGRIVGTSLDRNGLRPARYVITADGLVISGSEVGAVPIDDQDVVHKGKLGPGQMIAVDTLEGRFYADDDIKEALATRKPFKTWIAQHMSTLADWQQAVGPLELPAVDAQAPLTTLQMAFGYTSEELNVIIKPMFSNGQEPVGSMGDDTPAAVFSQVELGRPLFQFFKQRFAEVTNPPIDPLREELVMSLSIGLGRRRDILLETPEHAHLLQLTSPMLTDAQLAVVRRSRDPLLQVATVPALMPLDGRPDALRNAVTALCEAAERAVQAGAGIVVLSDRGVDAAHAPIPALLATSAVHHHLIDRGSRTRCSLVVETGEAREVHHAACLIGYGAEAVNPYLALASARNLAASRAALRDRDRNGAAPVNGNGAEPLALSIEEEAEQHMIRAFEKGLLKIMSKMGISTLDSYCGAQIFEAVGLSNELVTACFRGTPSRVGGISFTRLEHDLLARHRRAFPAGAAADSPALPHPGFYKFKKGGEYHSFNPAVVHALHHAVQNEHALNGDSHSGISAEGYALYKRYSNLVDSRPPTAPRDLLTWEPAGPPVPLAEVEPVEAIVKRFSTAAMSHGSTSAEAHETLAIAMNRLGGLSNSGEGGEAAARFTDERNSKIKQVASGRFGVTPAYLANAIELQIKMAQGSKPGEGGQLPGHKVNAEIASIRHTVPGVALISPPPHHDIYSIEDLAQLIFDLKQANPRAMVSVKLVSTAGVGTIAAGVAKGYADLILISGHSGGTGASALSSIKNAGIPWELGLAETQQTLLVNGLRGRVRLRADGGLKTGRDVVIAALLGADEFSFGTAALVAEGCIMARACHNNTCPVGIATQRADLRARFPGKPEMVMAFFRYMAQEIREILAGLGLRSLDEAVGRADLLRQVISDAPGADLLDLAPVLAAAAYVGQAEIRHAGERNPLPAENSLNERTVLDTRNALSGRGPQTLNYSIRNRDRSIGARLSGEIGQIYGDQGLPPGTVNITFTGSAGQSFGVFNAPGVQLTLVGEANDYVGKGMAGGTLVLRPAEGLRFAWHENVIAGNTLLYGATGGELFAAGQVGERFAVRNSGARAVVEGVGDHGCEYMTGGTVAVLGPTGRNFGAGMTGGVAYVLDETGAFRQRYNPQLVQLDRLNPQDETLLQQLLRRHYELTGSPFAGEILQRWSPYALLFWRVMPRDAVARIEATTEGAAETAGGKVAA